MWQRCTVLLIWRNKYDNTFIISTRLDWRPLSQGGEKSNTGFRQGYINAQTENHNSEKNWVSKWIKYVYGGSVLLTTNYGFLFRSRYIIPFIWLSSCRARCFNGFPSERRLEIKQPNDRLFAVTESWGNLVYCFFCTTKRQVGTGPVVTRYLSRSYDTAAIGAAVNNAVSAPAPRRRPRAPHCSPRLGSATAKLLGSLLRLPLWIIL